jgi:hypothetical protein
MGSGPIWEPLAANILRKTPALVRAGVLEVGPLIEQRLPVVACGISPLVHIERRERTEIGLTFGGAKDTPQRKSAPPPL